MELKDSWDDLKHSKYKNMDNIDSKLYELQKTTEDILQDSNDAWSELVMLISEKNFLDRNKFSRLVNDVEDINNKSKTGVPLLIYSICYDQAIYIELLHRTGKLDINLPDNLFDYSPLMWCFHLNRKNCCIELLNWENELNFNMCTKNGFSALNLLVPGTEMYEFAENHSLFTKYSSVGSFDGDVIYHLPEHFVTGDNLDETLDNINLQTAGSCVYENMKESVIDQDNSKKEFFETKPSFNFNNIIPNEYIEFADYDIPKLLNLLLSLPNLRPHDTTLPASLIFQCIRYATHVKRSESLVESIFHLCLTKILSSQDSSSGIISSELNNTKKYDIVTQSYWLGCLNFLYYYLYRDESFFKKFPSLLQELINGIRSMIIELCSSIQLRIDPLLIPACLEYTTIVDVKQTLYKKDWNFFKKRRQENEKQLSSSYDEIIAMLYPPSLEEQMKPSPLKVVQIFGALLYVLDLHQIHPLINQQCLSTTIQWFTNSLFNKVIRNKKFLSRSQAVQIRLNLSVIEDWIKNHDFIAAKPKVIDDFMWQRFPLTLIENLGEIDLSKPQLRNISFYKPTDTNEHHIITDIDNSLFYYQSFKNISQFHLQPLFQLLQWLQVATTLNDEESLDSTIYLLNRLSCFHLLKSIDRYRYEVGESKFNPQLKKILCHLSKSNKDSEYLFEKPLNLLALPTINELINEYVEVKHSYKFLPLIPIEIQDKIYEIHEKNVKLQETYNDNLKEDYVYDSTKFEPEEDDQLFKKLNAPVMAAHRSAWGANDIEENPW